MRVHGWFVPPPGFLFTHTNLESPWHTYLYNRTTNFGNFYKIVTKSHHVISYWNPNANTLFLF